jgi:hypothetical protein
MPLRDVYEDVRGSRVQNRHLDKLAWVDPGWLPLLGKQYMKLSGLVRDDWREARSPDEIAAVFNQAVALRDEIVVLAAAATAWADAIDRFARELGATSPDR